MPGWAKSVAFENYNTKKSAIYRELTYHAYIFDPQILIEEWEDCDKEQKDRLRTDCPSGIFWREKTWNRGRTVATYKKTNKILFLSAEHAKAFILQDNSNGSIEIKDYLTQD
jgi:hypothetical protein